MNVALVDNGSLEPSAHENLRRVARLLSVRCSLAVDAVSWKHSDRIEAGRLAGGAATTLSPWIRGRHARGERDFVLVPFFISPQGAIGTSLRQDLDGLRAELGDFKVRFSPGLSEPGLLERILADRVSEASLGLRARGVIVVDHGGPSPASQALRDRVASGVRGLLAGAHGTVGAASMEGCSPLLAEVLGSGPFSSGDVIVAPLFLSPGRHAGPDGDLARIARAAQEGHPGLRCRFTGLVGTHPLAESALAEALLETVHANATP